jgi:cell division protein ZapA
MKPEKTDKTTIQIDILGKPFQVACKPGEEQFLRVSAHYLDTKMRQIRSSGKTTGSDRIAIMAALNIANELIHERQQREMQSEQFREQIFALQEKVDAALTPTHDTSEVD